MGHDDPRDPHPHHHHHAHHDVPRAGGEVPAQHKARAPAYARVWVITCSDSRRPHDDEGGALVKSLLADEGHVVAGAAIVPDEGPRIVEELARAQAGGAQVAICTGGTGVSRRDSTFEAVSALLQRPLPGFGELFRALSFEEIGSAAMLSRAVGGVTREGLVVFALPGSPAAVRLGLRRLILPELCHLLEELAR